MTDSEPVRADCYSAGDRNFMAWTQRARARVLGPLIRALVRIGVTADGITLIGLLFGLAFCPVYLLGSPIWAIVLLALHVLADGLDGPIARHRGTESRKGSFTDTMSDQLVVMLTTVTLIVDGIVGVFAGSLYIFFYTVVIALAMVRNALDIPYSWLVRPRFVIYTWIPIELYVFAGTINYVLWIFVALLAAKMASGYVRIRRRI